MCGEDTLQVTNLLTVSFSCKGWGGYLELNCLYEKSFLFFHSTGSGIYAFSFMRINVIPIYLFFENSDSTNLEMIKHDTGFMDLVLGNLE